MLRRATVASLLLALSLGTGGTHAAEEAPSAAGMFIPAGSLANARSGHTATLLPDGRVLVVGGENRRARARASTEVWDPASASFAPAGTLAEARVVHSATLLPDGRVLVVGGQGNDDVLATAEVWDPASATFGPAGSLAARRMGHTATLLPDGRVLVIGGGDLGGSDFAMVSATAEVWDPATATFGPAGSLAKRRLGHTATLLPDGRALVVGGSLCQDECAKAEIRDPATASFGPAGSLPQERSGHTATLLPDGRVLVIGGRDNADFDVLASAEVWDPATASFGPAGSLAKARRFHSATALPDGRVIVVAGWEDDGFHVRASAEVWDPATASFGPAGRLAEGRSNGHTATLLPDGHVLVVGGSAELAGDPLASAEVWEPSESTSGTSRGAIREDTDLRVRNDRPRSRNSTTASKDR